jgi:hypothetical protein
MNEHVTQLLGAYHDGELRGKQLNEVDKHLAKCKICQDELDHLNALSEMLLTTPSPSNLSSEDTFVTQVVLRMPRKPTEPTVKKVFNLGWQAAPVGILGVWAFVQSLLMVSGILFLLLRLGFDLEPLTELVTIPAGGINLGMLFGFEGSGVGDLGRTAIETLLSGGPLGWGVTMYLALVLILGLLYASWIASWWVRQRHNQLAAEIVFHNQ